MFVCAQVISLCPYLIGIAVIAFNRPEALNSLSRKFVSEVRLQPVLRHISIPYVCNFLCSWMKAWLPFDLTAMFV